MRSIFSDSEQSSNSKQEGLLPWQRSLFNPLNHLATNLAESDMSAYTTSTKEMLLLYAAFMEACLVSAKLDGALYVNFLGKRLFINTGFCSRNLDYQ